MTTTHEQQLNVQMDDVLDHAAKATQRSLQRNDNSSMVTLVKRARLPFLKTKIKMEKPTNKQQLKAVNVKTLQA